MNDIIEQLVKKIGELARRVNYLERLEYGMAQNHGYVGGAWQKDPIRLGYSGVVARSASNESLAAGTNTIDDTAVPAGEIWVLTNISTVYTGTVTNVTLTVQYVTSSTAYGLFGATGITSGDRYDRQGCWVLGPGDNLRLLVGGATLNDNAYLLATGYRVDIDL